MTTPRSRIEDATGVRWATESNIVSDLSSMKTIRIRCMQAGSRARGASYPRPTRSPRHSLITANFGNELHCLTTRPPHLCEQPLRVLHKRIVTVEPTLGHHIESGSHRYRLACLDGSLKRDTCLSVSLELAFESTLCLAFRLALLGWKRALARWRRAPRCRAIGACGRCRGRAAMGWRALRACWRHCRAEFRKGRPTSRPLLLGSGVLSH